MRALQARWTSAVKVGAAELDTAQSAYTWGVNVPTKQHWRSPFRLKDVSACLDALVVWKMSAPSPSHPSEPV
jgi:hypothetical protein